MKENSLTEVVFILDRSGSMSGLEDDTIGGFNSILKKQREEDGDANVTTILFDQEIEMLHKRINIKDIKNITDKDYYVRGCTALLDALGYAINFMTNVTKNDTITSGDVEYLRYDNIFQEDNVKLKKMQNVKTTMKTIKYAFGLVWEKSAENCLLCCKT